jgi:hypothetical protein
LRMAGSDRLGHRAGQYILLHALAADSSVVKRAYSIAFRPGTTPSSSSACDSSPANPPPPSSTVSRPATR